MVGNSLKSGVFPVLALGGTVVYIPYHVTWAHETADFSSDVSDSGYPHQSGRWHELEHMGQLPQLVEQLQYHLSE
jgi:putative hydrolase of the HAD superfamily